MSEQLSFLERPNPPKVGAPYQPSSETSKIAAKRIAPNARQLRDIVLASIAAPHSKCGTTVKEATALTGLERLTVAARMTELSQEEPPRIVKLEREGAPVRRDGCNAYVRRV